MALTSKRYVGVSLSPTSVRETFSLPVGYQILTGTYKILWYCLTLFHKLIWLLSWAANSNNYQNRSLFSFLPMTHILISWTHLWSFIKISYTVLAIFANWFHAFRKMISLITNWFHSFHKQRTHRAIIGHTPKVDLDLLRVEQSFVFKELDTMWMLCDRLHAWFLTQSRLTTLLPSLIARLRVPQT